MLHPKEILSLREKLKEADGSVEERRNPNLKIVFVTFNWV